MYKRRQVVTKSAYTVLRTAENPIGNNIAVSRPAHPIRDYSEGHVYPQEIPEHWLRYARFRQATGVPK